jgi:hypothetical protein
MTGSVNAESFWRRVDRAGRVPPPHPDLGDLGPCWLWVGGRDRDGYGLTPRIGGETKAPRVSWVLAHGPIPEGGWVLHHCDTPPCVNPAHLFLGDHRANMRDRSAKGRQPAFIGGAGQDNGAARLTDALALAIRERWAAGESQPRLAAEYGISVGAVGLLVRGHTWCHLPVIGRPATVRPSAGERNGQAKLTAAQMQAIRRRYAQGGVTMDALAAAYGVSRSAVRFVIWFERWTHGLKGRVTGPPEETRRRREAR